jgi:hypothetical protein
MTALEIENEIESNIERVVNSNTDMKDFAGVIARGCWQIALQLARANELTVKMARREQV